MEGIEALLFDVFGTVVNWSGTVIAELRRNAPELTSVGQSYLDPKPSDKL
jgi:hypothetical protein